MSDYNNGKIHGWNGGECPVHPETMVQYWMRDGGVHQSLAEYLRWRVAHLPPSGMKDIIAFQVVEAYVEPKVIWVNEYADGPVAFNTERSARNYAMPSVVRIAVKYVEVVDDKEAKDD
jgi:hypothetical protein